MHDPAELPDRQLRIEQSLRGERAERDDDLRTNDLELTHEIRTARLDFLRHRIPIHRRPMLEHVTDEDVLSAQVNGGENLRQELTCCADERAAGLVLGLTWCLADAHQL